MLVYTKSKYSRIIAGLKEITIFFSEWALQIILKNAFSEETSKECNSH